MNSEEGDLGAAELRALVREVLLEAIPGELAAARAAGSLPAGDQEARQVRIRDDADLADLVRHIADECADDVRRADLAAGRVRYRLLACAAVHTGDADPPAAGVLRVERGAVTERQVREAAKTGVSIVAARGVVVTPLARDRARTSGVDIEKEH